MSSRTQKMLSMAKIQHNNSLNPDLNLEIPVNSEENKNYELHVLETSTFQEEIIVQTNETSAVAIDINTEIVLEENLNEFERTLLHSPVTNYETINNTDGEIIQEQNLIEFLSETNDTTEEILHEEETAEPIVKKRRKRRHVDKNDWKREENKRKRELGSEFFGKKKEGNKWTYDLKRPRKSLAETCNCKFDPNTSKLKCRAFSEEHRNNIFDSFWKKTWDEKKLTVNLLTQRVNTSRARNRKNEETSQRACSYNYYLEKNGLKLRVCKKLFSNTFGLKPWTIHNWLKAYHISTENNEDIKKTINENTTGLQKTRKCSQRQHLQDFFKSLAKVESHYCRSSSSKQYLEPIWKSKSELYTLYKETWCSKFNESPMSIAYFCHMFEDLNLSLFKPKKDECDVCISFKSKNITEEEYHQHIQKKDEARHEKELDKQSNNSVFTMDLQSVLLCPKSNAGSLYFKTKLIVHNFTVYDLKTKAGYCNIWHEGEGGLSAQSFASIISTFIINHLAETENNGEDDNNCLIFWSDGCGCQNRNATIANALLNLAVLRKITIIQKYLERGHTQMECDSMHSVIERKLRNRNINVPADYVDVCRTARLHPKNYNVEYLTNSFFKNFDQVHFVNSIRPGRKAGDPRVNDVRAYRYNSNGTIDFKLRHVADWKALPSRYNKVKATELQELPRLYSAPLKIKKEKFDHLMSLKNILPKDYHHFYDQLPHE